MMHIKSIHFSHQLCRAVHKHHQEHEVLQVKTEKEEVLKLRKIASTIAKEIKHFWDSVHKVTNDLVEYVTVFCCHI